MIYGQDSALKFGTQTFRYLWCKIKFIMLPKENTTQSIHNPKELMTISSFSFNQLRLDEVFYLYATAGMVVQVTFEHPEKLVNNLIRDSV